MKRITGGILAAALMVSMGLPAARAAGTGFRDVQEGVWYTQAVEYCRVHALMDGVTADTFAPDAPMTRGLLALAFYRAAGSPAVSGAAGFPDVPASSPCAPAVCWAAQNGVMSGYSDGRFGPEDCLTREQIAVVLWRYEGFPAAPRGADFADEGSISPYASSAVDWVRSAGLMSGIDGYRFDPQGVTTRAQAAMILMNYLRRDYVLSELAALPADCRPRGMAVMSDGALLVADSYNKVLWRVSGGNGTVYAGGGEARDPYGQPMGGYNDAHPSQSLFQTPWALAPFLEGWAVSDTGNAALRLVTADAVQTINAAPAEEGLSANDYGITFTYPTGLAADEAGSLYAADTHQGKIVKISPDGTAVTFASGLNDPMGLCWSGGALYVAETGASRIVRIAEGKVSAVAGGSAAGLQDGAADRALFCEPQAVAADSSGAVYVADTGNSAIRRIKDGVVTTLTVRDPGDMEQMYPISPTGLLVRGNTLYVCDSFSCKILALTLK